MAEFTNLLWPDAAPLTPGKKTKGGNLHRRGCEFCPQNEVHGIKKIKGKVEGKSIFVWAQSPGPNENIEGRELIGNAGKWFWDRMAEVDIEREDCDIQNVMRCFPANRKNGKLVMRDPSDEELFCCSLYTDQAIQKSRAKVHLVLGKMAAKQLFGSKFKKDGKVFWSDKLNGKVVIVDHPAYFIRGFAPAHRLRDFRIGLQTVAKLVKQKAGKFGFLEEMDYVAITDGRTARKHADQIRAKAKKGIRITADLETGRTVRDGVIEPLCYGFTYKGGSARVFLLEHRTGIDVARSDRDDIRRVVVSLLEDEKIKKTCHHGSYDKEETEKIMGCKFKSYDFDTNYSEYLKYPGRRSYALAEIAAVRYPEFTGYKEVIMPEAAPEGMTYKQAYKQGKLDFAKVPWNKMVLYNGADDDLTKRIEVTTKDVPLPLLRVYMDAAFTLDKMEKNGPLFDYKQSDALAQIYPTRLKKQLHELQMLAGDPDFNPSSPPQVAAVIYDKLQLLDDEDGRSTDKNVLELLGNRHSLPKKILEYRRDMKLDSTYRVGFRACADSHNGRLFTKWWLTGTKTGRLSSGGSRDGEEIITVNLQNIHSDPQVKNMLISDARWREIYKAWKDDGETDSSWSKQFLEYIIFLILDYSQNELRFMAQSADDPELIKAFCTGKDIHCIVGHEITGWSMDVIANNERKRRLVKSFHFGLIYGLTVDGMVNYLKANGVKNVKRHEVKEQMDKYYRKYKRVKEFQEWKKEEARKYGYVSNILGFKCPIHVKEDSDGGAFWENQAVNTPIQGGAHQLLLIALAMLKRKPQTYALLKIPNMEIHDAIANSVKVKDLLEAKELGHKLLEKEVVSVLETDFKIKWKIPQKADCKVGFRYGVGVKIKEGMQVKEVMNNWCQANQLSMIALQKELKKAQGSISND